MSSMQFSLDEEEKEELCKRFDTQKNGRLAQFLISKVVYFCQSGCRV